MEWRGNITYRKDKKLEQQALVKFLEILIDIDKHEYVVNKYDDDK